MRSQRTHVLDTNPGHRGYASPGATTGVGPKGKLRRTPELCLPRELRSLVLHYQPIVDTVTGQIARAEALLRWHDPERGLMTPAEILPHFDSPKLMIPLGQWVLHQVAADCCHWREAGCGPIRIAVNASPSQLHCPEFIEACLETTAAWTDESYGLDIEITEDAFQGDASEALSSLQRLRSADVRIALDDFGTGYSSLERLANLPVDTLKIDRSFTARLPGNSRTAAVVSMIVSLARSLKLTTIAEGVETPEQFEWLRQVGCDYSQGFLHCRPLAGIGLEQLLRDRGARESSAADRPAGTENIQDIEWLIDSLISSIGYVPANAQPLREPSLLPPRLQAIARETIRESAWRAWQVGNHTRFVRAQRCTHVARKLQRPALQAWFYDTDGKCAAAGVWTLGPGGKWRLYDAVTPRSAAPVGAAAPEGFDAETEGN